MTGTTGSLARASRLAIGLLAIGMTLAACTGTPPNEPATDLAAIEKRSSPGVYEGYSTPQYDGHQRSSFYIPVRDGTRLAADLFRPTQNGELTDDKLPVVWMHTPYNRRTYRGEPAALAYPGYALRLVEHGYNVAVVDFRGVYASYGKNIAYNRGEWVDDAKWDAYDVTEWFADQPYSSGNIGMWGCSATGGSQMQALTTRPPSLKAIIPMSAEFDAYHFTTVGGVSVRRPIAPPGQTGAQSAIARRDAAAAAVDGPDGEALLAEAVASHADNIESVGYLPFKDSVSESTGLEWWSLSSPHTYLEDLKAADTGVMAVANWDEAGTRHGSFFTFNNLNPDKVKLLVGPATHCAWSAVKEETGFDLLTEELRFYDHWLKGVDNNVMSEPAVTYYTYNAPADRQWAQSGAWPPKEAVRTNFYLAGLELTSSPPVAASSADVAFSPAAQSATVTIEAADGGIALETPPLSAELQVTGHPTISLWLETDSADADVTAYLEDVAPDGTARSYQMIGRQRASHRALAEPPYNHLGLPWHSNTQADARPIPAGEPVQLEFDMLPMSYVFAAGHRIRLKLTVADPSGDGADASATILSGGQYPSYISLPVIPRLP